MTKKPCIIVTAPVPQDLRQLLDAAFDTVDVPAGQSPLEALPQSQWAAIDGMVCTVKTRVDGALLDALPALKVVSNFAVGFDNVDMDAANARKVLVCNTPGVLDGAVADLTIGLMLCVARNLVAGDAFVRSGAWTKGPFPLATDIRGKTLGLLGMGRIGRVVARTARAFDMDVIYHNRKPDAQAESEGLARYVERDALFAQADVVSVHIPLTAETRHSVGAREFGLMKKTAILLNTARGAVVDEAALIDALKNGTIAGAGLDVMTQEPLPVSSPLIGMPNVVLQAHIGSATVETRRAMIDLAVHNLVDALGGKQPKAMVNGQAWPLARQAGANA
ncbi:D-glycerate dehydrogenase [Bordetella genomosp. 9]|uniref:2-hydroxyacid dehydrogenase n=1 Tax=Bordetella genomosp. 9 TaxID=1416803 RepID=UPI000A28DDEF|nr:D-glycerate dehydrogenase [Bordetella genomosp. 9]ARP89668.1 D-glycerate dehydrogenase [Bordetella genomosp. 9]